MRLQSANARCMTASGVCLALCLMQSSALAQATGRLLAPGRDTALFSSGGDSADVTFGVGGAEVGQLEAQREAREEFAVLVFDPLSSAQMRASSWTFSVSGTGSAMEGKVQGNLCDVVRCSDQSALGLVLAGPIRDEAQFSEVGSLDALIGTARLEANWSNKLTDRTGMPTVTLGAALGQPRFKFRNPADLAPRTLDRAVFTLGIGIGKKWNDRSIHAEYRYEDARKARAPQNVCVPASFGSPGTLTCTNLVVGEPTRQLNSVALLNMKRAIGRVAGVGFRFAVDLRSRATGIDVPIYVLPDVEKGPLGGVRLGYRSETRNITLAFFLGGFTL